MDKPFPHLFSPITIRGKTFKNRILAAPKGIPLSDRRKDHMAQDALDFYERLARGGAARVVTSECDVEYGSAVYGTYNMFLDPLPESLRASVRQYAENCHKYGALAFMHFGHMGAYCRDEKYNARMRAAGKIPDWRPPASPVPLRPDGSPYMPAAPLGPSRMVIREPRDGITASLAYDLNDGKTVNEMTAEDMDRIADAFARCAINVKASGLDGMSIHSGHGFIFSQWVSRRFNHRTDEFGGTMENRARFPILCLQRIRDAVGEDFIVEMRFSADESISPISGREFLPDLVTVDETADFFRELDRHPGLLDIAHITGGLHFVPYYNTRTIPNSYFPMGVNLDAAARVKAAVKNIYVGCVGAMADPQLCEEAIASGKTDFVILARQLCVADPEFPNKAQRGQTDQIDNCLRCTICCRNGHCSVNPLDTKKKEYDIGIPRGAKAKNVVIVGGGIAGMKAAEYACLAGHAVTLYERSGALGGVLRYTDGDRFKSDICRYYHAMERRIRGMNICIRLNTEATAETIRTKAPDAVIIAVGAAFNDLGIPGEDRANVISCTDAYLMPERVGRRVVILGGGLTGCEAAIHLADRGHAVTIVTHADRLMNRVNMVGPANGSTDTQLILLKELGVEAVADSSAVGIDPAGVRIQASDGTERFLPADTVIKAAGLSSRAAEVKTFSGTAPLVTAIGDCVKPANIGDAVLSAYEAVLALDK